MTKYVSVPVKWLKELLEYAKRAESDEKRNIPLIGYARSAQFLIDHPTHDK